MALTLSDLNDLHAGYRQVIWAGEMPYAVAKQLGLRNHNVYLSRESLAHILEKHPDVTLFTLLCLPIAIQRGLLVKERKNPRVVIVSYQDPESARRYLGALKTAAQECEVWVSSFYQGRKRQTRRILQRGDLLKEHS